MTATNAPASATTSSGKSGIKMLMYFLMFTGLTAGTVLTAPMVLDRVSKDMDVDLKVEGTRKTQDSSGTNCVLSFAKHEKSWLLAPYVIPPDAAICDELKAGSVVVARCIVPVFGSMYGCRFVSIKPETTK